MVGKEISIKIPSYLFDEIHISPHLLNEAHQANCKVFENYLHHFHSIFPSKKVVVYATKQIWMNKFGSPNECANLINYNAKYKNYNSIANFHDWSNQQFGTLAYPYEKGFTQTVLCGQFH